MSLNEEVLVIENNKLKTQFSLRNGLNRQWNSEIYKFILNNHRFLIRRDAEQAIDFKQIIPYVIINNSDNVLLFRRKNKQTEARLHNKYSLGVGGHINNAFSNEFNNEFNNESLDIIMNGLYKELDEEIILQNKSTPQFIGVINDDSAEVGKYHLGLLFEITTSSVNFTLPEFDKMSAEWVSYNDLNKYYDFMETWSQIIVDDYFILH